MSPSSPVSLVGPEVSEVAKLVLARLNGGRGRDPRVSLGDAEAGRCVKVHDDQLRVLRNLSGAQRNRLRRAFYGRLGTILKQNGLRQSGPGTYCY